MSSILVTGGTGSFGQAFVRRLLEHDSYERIVVFSRDELKQHDMRCAGLTDERLRYFIGDVRDLQRLRRAMRGVGTVIHAAALKQVDSCEFNPLEAKKTNIDGTANVIDAALDCGVQRVLMVGTDKAVDPVNLYGATKQVAERLMIDANVYAGDGGTRFACTRYGNVITSRGAVLPRFQQQWDEHRLLTITDPRMTRFVLTLDHAVSFVIECLADMHGGEVFVPRLPAVSVTTVAEAVAFPDLPQTVNVGRRPGEKIHELLVSAHEARRTEDLGNRFVVYPITSKADFPGTVEYGSDSPFVERLDVSGFRVLAGLELQVAA